MPKNRAKNAIFYASLPICRAETGAQSLKLASFSQNSRRPNSKNFRSQRAKQLPRLNFL